MNILKMLFGLGKNDEAIKAALLAGGKIIDVRSQGEFASGHVKGSQNIPLDKIPSQAGKILDSKVPVIFCCASGMRSGQATSLLRNKGLKEVYNGGSWNNVKRLQNS